MIEMREELFAAPVNDWQNVPFVVNHHKWWLKMYRFGDKGDFFIFSFVSPKGRKYSFRTDGGRVTDADVALANGVKIASFWGDTPESMHAVIRLTPKHILDRLFVLLDAIG